MKINLISVAIGIGETPEAVYTARVELDGVDVGKASDCDLGRWVIVADEAHDELLGGCYPANTVAGLGYAITQCVEGIEAVTIDGRPLEEVIS